MFDVISTISFHEALLITHIGGLVLGFGVAISIDYMLLRALLAERLSSTALRIAVKAASLTSIGLLILWLSGLGFLLEYNVLSPEKLSNPKIHAKIFIVVLLTLNGMTIHHVIIPLLWRNTGKNVLQSASTKTLLLFATCSTFSTVSWIFPVIFGFNKTLNFDYPMSTLLAQYFACVVVLGVVVFAVLYYWRSQLKTRSPVKPRRRRSSRRMAAN